jgi:hypothetical protein
VPFSASHLFQGICRGLFVVRVCELVRGPKEFFLGLSWAKGESIFIGGAQLMVARAFLFGPPNFRKLKCSGFVAEAFYLGRSCCITDDSIPKTGFIARHFALRPDLRENPQTPVGDIMKTSNMLIFAIALGASVPAFASDVDGKYPDAPFSVATVIFSGAPIAQWRLWPDGKVQSGRSIMVRPVAPLYPASFGLLLATGRTGCKQSRYGTHLNPKEIRLKSPAITR